MIRECYSKFHIGSRVFGEKPPFEDTSVTGGLCPECFELEMDKLAREGHVPLGWRRDWEAFKKNKRRRNMLIKKPKITRVIRIGRNRPVKGDFVLWENELWIIHKVKTKSVILINNETGEPDELLIDNLAPTDIQTWEAE